MDIKRLTIKGFVWKLLQSAGTQIVTFAVSIILAQLIVPEKHGIIAVITIFITIAMVFVETGFSSAVIQKKDITDADISTAFYTCIFIGLFLYGVLFFAAPGISIVYKIPELTLYIRVLCAVVPIASTYSIQNAILNRELEMRKVFIVRLTGALVQGVAGVILAITGFEVWALIISTILFNVTVSIASWIACSWRPMVFFSFSSLKSMFPFSFKVFLSSFFNTICNNLRNIIIGIAYTSVDLAYYNKGYQFPTIIMNQVAGSMSAIMFSSLSKYQNDWKSGLNALRRSIQISMFVMTPMMLGLFAVARPMVLVLLRERWEPSIEYVQLVSIMCLFWPLAIKMQAINARGHSGVSLRMNLVAQISAIIVLIFTYKISVRVMIIGTIVQGIVILIPYLFIYRKYLDYRIRDQLSDWAPSFVKALIMCLVCMVIEKFWNFGNLSLLIVQVITGIIVYILLALFTKDKNLRYIVMIVKPYFVRP